MKKISIRIVTFLLIASSIGSVQAFAMTPNVTVPSSLTEVTDSRAEQTTIYYRTHNGVRQYRVWSNTEMKWITEWTDM